MSEHTSLPEVVCPRCDGTVPDAIALDDLHERLIQKRNLLQKMASEARGSIERNRLLGKAQGVDLACSFIEEVRRGA